MKFVKSITNSKTKNQLVILADWSYLQWKNCVKKCIYAFKKSLLKFFVFSSFANISCKHTLSLILQSFIGFIYPMIILTQVIKKS